MIHLIYLIFLIFKSWQSVNPLILVQTFRADTQVCPYNQSATLICPRFWGPPVLISLRVQAGP